MGSRRRRHAALVAVLAGACTVGTPPGFSGDVDGQWTFPLVGPLEDGPYVAPVLVNGRGPYLFAFDLDATYSVIDTKVVEQVGLPTFVGMHWRDDYGLAQSPRRVGVASLKLGTLVVVQRMLVASNLAAVATNGRRISGIIGRDILRDTLVFGFDRDRGLGLLSTLKAFRPPAGATAIRYRTGRTRLMVPPQLVQAQLGAVSVAMALDLGGRSSTLGDPAARRAGLTWAQLGADAAAVDVDELGTVHPVTRQIAAQRVSLSDQLANGVAFQPLAPARRAEADGTLGADFFRPFNVWVSLDASTYYLAPRIEVPVATRLSRWMPGPFAECPHVGCIETQMIEPAAGSEPAVLSITRDDRARGLSLEVVLEAIGTPTLPPLVVNLPPGIDHLAAHVEPELRGRRWAVVDASPYPHACPGNAGCIVGLAR